VDRRVTIADVARAAGVSAATVSRALSNPGRVNPETLASVRKVADALGYRSHLHAARVSRRGQVIVVMVTLSENSFYLRTLRAIERSAAAWGASIVIMDAREDARTQDMLIARVGQLADGAILISPRLTDRAILELARRLPTVVLNRQVRGVPSVVQNSVQGMGFAVRHLVALGHTEISHVTGHRQARIAGARLRALEQVCRASGVQLRSVAGDGTFAGGVEAAVQWAVRPTSAVLCFNDESAIGFVHSAVEQGFRVPEDVSVIGMGDNAFSVALRPPLTTIGFSASAQATAVVQRLFGSSPTQGEVVVPMRLIVRGSTGVVSAGRSS